MSKGKKNWITNLPPNKEMGVFDGDGNLLTTFSMSSYKLENEALYLTLINSDGVAMLVGASPVRLSKGAYIRVHYSPIIFYPVDNYGLSPQVVYELEKDFRVKPVCPKKQESIYDRARVHNFKRA